MIRTAGALKGTFASSDEDIEAVLKRLNETELPRNQVSQVSAKQHIRAREEANASSWLTSA